MPFPETVRRLPRTDLQGADVYVHDDGRTQVVFIEVGRNRPELVVPTHTHDTEWGIVVEGEIVMSFPDRTEVHSAGSTHLIPGKIPHGFRFRPGTSSIHFFIERRVPLP